MIANSLRILFAAASLVTVCTSQTSYPGLVFATVQVQGQPFDLHVDLAVPSGNGPWPLVAWIHGGGWAGGSHSPIPSSTTRLLQRGYAVASIQYRLTGQAVWPAQLQDCKAAIRYLRANATNWSLDPDRFAVMGSSAGGHLVAALATTGDAGVVTNGSYTADLEGTVGAHATTSSRVQCAIDLYGPTAMLQATDYPTFDHDGPGSPESRLVGAALQDAPERWATVDPISFLSPDDPPLLAVHGTADGSVPFYMSEALHDAALAIGLDVEFEPLEGAGHGGPEFGQPSTIARIDAMLDSRLRDLPDVTVRIDASDATADESGDTATFTITRSGSTALPLSVRLWLAGEVEVTSDCAPLPLRCTIPAGQASIDVVLQPLQDTLVEGDERARLHIGSSRDYRIDSGAASAVATLSDDDDATGLPIVSVLPLDAAAAEAGGNPGAVRFVRTTPNTAALDVLYTIAGTARNGLDYQPLSGTVTIPAGANGRVVVVQPLQDGARETGETVVLRVAAAATYARGAARAAHVVIADDERTAALPTVAIVTKDIVAGENAGDGAFQLTRSLASPQPLLVQLVVEGTATGGIDYVSLPTQVTIAPGEHTVALPVQVLDDLFVEGIENVVVTIVPQSTYQLAVQPSAELWLSDDEAPPPPAATVTLDVGPLHVGRDGIATITGGSPAGIAAIWIGLAPGHLPLPSFGTVQLDPSQAAPFVVTALDGDGTAVQQLTVPPVPGLTGQAFWWQAVATVDNPPWLGLSNVVRREVIGDGGL